MREKIVRRYLAVNAEPVGQFHLVQGVRDTLSAVDPESVLIRDD